MKKENKNRRKFDVFLKFIRAHHHYHNHHIHHHHYHSENRSPPLIFKSFFRDQKNWKQNIILTNPFSQFANSYLDLFCLLLIYGLKIKLSILTRRMAATPADKQHITNPYSDITLAWNRSHHIFRTCSLGVDPSWGCRKIHSRKSLLSLVMSLLNTRQLSPRSNKILLRRN